MVALKQIPALAPLGVSPSNGNVPVYDSGTGTWTPGTGGGLSAVAYQEYVDWLDNEIKTLTLSPALTTMGKCHVDVWQESPYDTDSNVKLLVCSETASGSTAFHDFSASNRTVTANNSAQHSNAQAKYGSTSALVTAGTQDSVSTGSSSDFDFGTGDFCIEFWMYRTGADWFSGFSTGGTTAYAVLMGFSDGLYVSSNGSSWNVFSGAAIGTSATTWHHIALVRYGTSLKLYRDGTAVPACTATIGAGDSLGSSAHGWEIGRWASSWATVYFEDLRITKGSARYTGDFTPPTSLWPAQSLWTLQTGFTSWLTATDTLKVRAPSSGSARTARVHVSGVT